MSEHNATAAAGTPVEPEVSISEDSRLDPHSANVTFSYEDIGGANIGRVYYWYDPHRRLPPISDEDFRDQHPEIGDADWQRLHYEAFDRGEKAFVERVEQSHPRALADPENRAFVRLGRLFGPYPPRRK